MNPLLVTTDTVHFCQAQLSVQCDNNERSVRTIAGTSKFAPAYLKTTQHGGVVVDLSSQLNPSKAVPGTTMGTEGERNRSTTTHPKGQPYLVKSPEPRSASNPIYS
jgi:hypothetical protein